jgi:hypothetical protein
MSRHHLFPHVSEDQINNGEQFMMSTADDARKTIDIMQTYCGDTASLTIADAFACLGGNTYSFSIAFKSVDAYEMDETRCRGLQQNVLDYPGQEQNQNVTVKCQDCQDPDGILDTQYDVIFLDPPWVNPATDEVDGQVFEDAFVLSKLIAEKQTAEYIFLKLPLKSKYPYEFPQLIRRMAQHWTHIHEKIIVRRKPSYTIVCASRRTPSATHTHAAHTHAAHTHAKRHAHMSALLTQLRAFQFF